MDTPLRHFLEIPYDQLEEMNLAGKADRVAGKDPGKIREERVQYLCPPPIEVSLLRKIEQVALRSYRVLECKDVSRVDIRVGKDGEAYFLEVNPLPGLSPTYGDLPIIARRRVTAEFGVSLQGDFSTALRLSWQACAWR